MNESENTWRSVAEKPLLVKSAWCYLGVHRWTQYNEPRQRREGVYVIDYQMRCCASCNLVGVKQLRKIIS